MTIEQWHFRGIVPGTAYPSTRAVSVHGNVIIDRASNTATYEASDIGVKQLTVAEAETLIRNWTTHRLLQSETGFYWPDELTRIK